MPLSFDIKTLHSRDFQKVAMMKAQLHRKMELCCPTAGLDPIPQAYIQPDINSVNLKFQFIGYKLCLKPF